MTKKTYTHDTLTADKKNQDQAASQPTKNSKSSTSASKSSLDDSTPISENDVLKPIEFDQKGSSTMKINPKISAVIMAVAVFLGLGTGFGVYQLTAQTTSSNTTGTGSDGQQIQQVAGDKVKAGDVFGSPDASTFKDAAEGYLEAGGLDGEGSHKLIRPGGPSQTVYLTSSVTDLDKFVGMDVKIWGETFKAQKAGWLMDVGRVEIVNPEGQAPGEEE